MWIEETEPLMATAIHQSPWSCPLMLFTTKVKQLTCGQLYQGISHSQVQASQHPFHYPCFPRGETGSESLSSRCELPEGPNWVILPSVLRCFPDSTQEMGQQDWFPGQSYSRARALNHISWRQDAARYFLGS